MHTSSANKVSQVTVITAAHKNFLVIPSWNSNWNNALLALKLLGHPGYQGTFWRAWCRVISCFPGLSSAHSSMTKIHWELIKALSCDHGTWRNTSKSRDLMCLKPAWCSHWHCQHSSSLLALFLKVQPGCAEEEGGRETRGHQRVACCKNPSRKPANLAPGCFDAFHLLTMASHLEF